MGGRHEQKHVLIDGNMLQQKALSSHKDFSKRSPEMSDTKPFTASEGWLNRSRNRFGLKNINITREAASANEDVAATFLAKLKKSSRRKDTLQRNETWLFWEKMCNRTYTHKNAKKHQGIKHGRTWLGVVAHACNCSTLGPQAAQIT